MNKYYFFLLMLVVGSSCANNSKINEEALSLAETLEDFDNSEIDTSLIFEDWSEEDWNLDPYVATRDIYNPSRTLFTDLVHTKLEVKFNWEQSRMNGRATITAKQHFYPSDSIVLDAKGMDIIKIELKGKPLNYTYLDSLKLNIKLDKIYSKGENFTIVIDYVSKPDERTTGGSAAITSDKGLYFINPKGEDKNKMPQIWTQGETEANSVWFPTIDAPNAKSSQEMYITVDSKYTTLSNGKLMSTKQNVDGTKTDYWKQDLPHAPYLFMMAVGEFKVIKDSYTRQNGTKMEVNYYVEPAYEKEAKAIFGETPEMIKFFSERLSVDFPWDKYSQIVVRDYVSGAMENTGAVIFGDYVYKNERELVDGNDQSTIAHELFHHWFGDLVTCESWANLPLNESFANYSQYLWDEHHFGLDEADYQAEQEADGYYQSSTMGYHNLIWFDHTDKEDMFDGHSYNKGGRILHMLRSYLGDDAFFNGLNNYLVTNKYKAAEVHNLRMAFEEVSGEDLNWFFNQWFLSSGHPIIHTSQVINDNNTVTIKVSQKQNLDIFPLFKLPVKVAIWDNEGRKIHKITVDSLEQSFTFSYSGALKNVLFDEEQMLLAKVFEEKPMNQFIHQYYNSNRYKARMTALTRVSKSKNQASEELVKQAMRDPFWDIRQKALDISLLPAGDISDELQNQILEISRKDSKSAVRTKAVYAFSRFSKGITGQSIDALKSIIQEDPSFNVVSAAMTRLADLDSIEVMNFARSLEKQNINGLNVAIADVYSRFGEVQDYQFLENLNLNGKLNGYDQLRGMLSYTYFITRQDIDLMEKSLAVYSYLTASGNMYVKWYLSGAIEYNISILSDKSAALEIQISEDETAKAYEAMNIKKALKQRYDDLIANLSPLIEVESGN
jgi:aminopeptidase N